MFSKVSILAVLAVGAYLSVSNHGAEALTCYNCNATAACNSPVNTTSLGIDTCPTSNGTTQCGVLTFQLGTNTSNIFTWRGCVGNQTCDQLNTTSAIPAGLTLTGCTVCSKDHCNSATVFAVPLVALVVSFLAVKYVQ